MAVVYQILNTVPADTAAMHAIIDHAIAFTQKNNYPVFPGHDKTIFDRDMETGQQYKIVIQDDIACIFSICYNDLLLWREKEKDDAVYLHRMAAHPRYKGKKLFKRISHWARQHTREQNRKFLRLDTWADNPKIIAYYQHCGFKRVGYLITPDIPEILPSHRNLRLALMELKVINK